MDLAGGAKRVIVMMSHKAPSGASKIVAKCTLPITAHGCVDTVVTELATFRFRRQKLILDDVVPGVSIDQVRASTAAHFELGPNL